MPLKITYRSGGRISSLIRSFFTVPDSEYVLAEADAAGFQLRIVAALSGDENMKRAFTHLGGDMHSMTAHSIFCRGWRHRPVYITTQDGKRTEWPLQGVIEFSHNGVIRFSSVEDVKVGDALAFNNEVIPGGTVTDVTFGSDQGEFTLEHFIANKGIYPFKDYRAKAKNANFSLVFNTVAKAFAINTLEKEWTLDECRDYINQNDLQKKLDGFWKRMEKDQFDGGLVSYDFCHYWIAAIDIRKRFFEQYPGVRTWIDAQIDFAKKNGYVVSPFGAIRRLPQLKLSGEDTYTSKIKNLSNIACNTPVQNFEAVLMNEVVVEVSKYIRERQKKSRVIGMVHDSVVFLLHRTEIDEIFTLARRVFGKDRPQNNGVPMEIEFEVADVSKNEFWGFGREYSLPA